MKQPPAKRVAVAEPGPLYQYIEFCRNSKTLWGKLQEGRWDWLGRKPDGQFVLGRPRRVGGSMLDVVSTTLRETGAKEGQHGVKVYGWSGQPNSQPSCQWVTNPSKARGRFEQEVAWLEDPASNPILARVVLIQNGQATDERFIAQTPPPNYQ